MDGIPLTLEQIATFCDDIDLESLLEDLVRKEYLRLEYPKRLVKGEGIAPYREYDSTKQMGYNIVTGRLSFELSRILDPRDITPTLVATDVSRMGIPDGDGLRRLSTRESLRLFGYPEWYSFPTEISEWESFDLIGNTVAVPVVEFVSNRLLEHF